MITIAPSTRSILAIGLEDGMLEATPSLLADQDVVVANPVAATGESTAEATTKSPTHTPASGSTSLTEEPAGAKLAMRAVSGVPLINVRAASAALDEMHLHLVIPNKFAGVVLGTHGSRMKQVIANTDCNAWMSPRDGDHDRSVVILGSFGQCSLAQTMFIDYLSEGMQKAKEELKEVTVVMFLRDDVVAWVIGKKGEALRQVREQSNARVNILRDEVEGKRPCIIVGKFRHVLQAEKFIDDRVHSLPSSRASAASSGKRPASPGHTSAAATGAKKMRPLQLPPSAAGAKLANRVKRQSQVLSGPKPGGTDSTKRIQSASKSDLQPSTKLLLPSHTAGAIIGKQGANLQHIRDTCKVRAEVLSPSETPQFPGERVVILHGTVAARQAGADAVLRAAFSSPPPEQGATCTLKMLVTAAKPSLSTDLENVSRMCGILAKVGDKAPGERGEQLVALEGQLAQVSAALSILGIQEQAADAEASSPRAEASRHSPRGSVAERRDRHHGRGSGAKGSGKAGIAIGGSGKGTGCQAAKGRWGKGARAPSKGRGKTAAPISGNTLGRGAGQPSRIARAALKECGQPSRIARGREGVTTSASK